MPAYVETMMYAGAVPWHGLGTYVGDDDILSDEAIVAAGLDWSADKTPLFYEESSDSPWGSPSTKKIDTHVAMIRSDNKRCLGIVGDGYTPLQNKDSFALMDSLVKDGEMKYHTAGSLREGKQVWLLGQIGSFDVVPGDRVDKFMMLSNSHDGSSALRMFFTNVRVVCANTAALALDGARGKGMTLRHTKNLTNRVEQAQKALALAVKHHEKMEEFMRHLADTNMTASKMDEFINSLIPLPEEGKSMTRAENQQGQLLELFERGRGQDIPGVRGTAWAAFNAVTEYTNYERSTRGGQSNRFESALFGSGAKMVDQAVKLLAA